MLLLSGLATALASGAFAQGDDCSTASTISGLGSFPYNTTGATSSGFAGGGGVCSFTNNQDVFMQWTAPVSGDFVFDTFGTSYDTKLSVHHGIGCTATCGDYNDDTGGLQSEVHISGLVAGDPVLIQVGGFGVAFGMGVVNIATWIDPCLGSIDDGFEENDACSTPSPITAGSHTGLFASTSDLDFYSISVPAGDRLEVQLTGATFDVDFNVYDSACNLLAFEFDDWAYTNTSAVTETIIFEAISDPTNTQNCTNYDLDISFTTPPPPPINNLCSTATTLVGTGTTPFDTTTAYTSGFDGGGACGGGSDTINQDIFYQWTVPATGDYQFDTDTSSFDTKLSIHTGTGCAATCSAYDNDGGMGFQSLITLTGLNVGDMLLIQVGGFGTESGAGVLNISPWVDPCAVPDDMFEENDDCVSAVAMVDGTYPALFAKKGDKDHYSLCVANGGSLDVDILFTHANGDMNIFLWDAADPNCGTSHPGSTFLAEGWSVNDNESISWTNTTGADLDVILEVTMYDGSVSDCNNYDLIISGSGTCGGGVGSTFCDPAANNSTGAPTVLTGSWGSGVGSDLHLEVTGGIPGELVYILAGNEATAGAPISNGQFCLIGTSTAQFFRYNVIGTDWSSIGGFDPTGTMINSSGTSTTGFGYDVPSTIPAAVPVAIMAGDTWHFQAWFRDTPAAVGSSNFSNGLSVNF
ncbi:MAG: hypothetical protein GY930_10695 [bacterium]|nr:hypothetical protein [bacterium]